MSDGDIAMNVGLVLDLTYLIIEIFVSDVCINNGCWAEVNF